MIKRVTIMKLLCLTTAICAAAGAASAQDIIAIHAGRIITVSSEEIIGGTVVIENGRIRAVGRDVEVPFNATVHRYPSGVVLPGLIEVHTAAGLRSANENLPVVPYISVLDGIDPNSSSYRNALRDGVTALNVIPGNSTRIGGQGAVLRPIGAVSEDMVIKSPSAMKISLQPTAGETRMTQMAALRRDFLELHDYLAGLAPVDPGTLIREGKTGGEDLAGLLGQVPDWKSLDFSKIPEDKIDPQRRPLVEVVRGRLPAFIYCPRAADLFKAFELIDAQGLSATLVLGPDAHRARDLLAGRKDLGLVILGSQLDEWEKDPDSGEERRYLTARILHDAGIRFAVTARDRGEFRSSRTGLFSGDGSYHLWYQAALLVRQGIPRAEALRAVTLNPARILGLDQRMGTIEPGKDANLAVFTGDPLDARSWVDRVFVEGREVYRREQDRDLQELLRRPRKDF